jgi:hypothetical protein
MERTPTPDPPQVHEFDGLAHGDAGPAAQVSLRGPDFFIVGAPKSGTTSLHAWLDDNPDVFMAPGEPHYFSPERQLPWRARTWPDYLREFEAGQGARRLGEKAVWYLSNEPTPARIATYSAGAQIIAILRHPIDAMRSLHGYNLFYGEEDVEDFFEALAAEPERCAGRRIPAASRMPWNLLYRDAVDYVPQVSRYFSTFGEDRVLVLLFDDLSADPAGVYATVTEFLGVSGAGPASFAARNPNKVPRSTVLQRVLHGSRPPLLTRASRLVGRRARRWLIRRVERANTSERPPPGLDPERRRRLERELAPQIEELASLIDRDLSGWTVASS